MGLPVRTLVPFLLVCASGCAFPLFNQGPSDARAGRSRFAYADAPQARSDAPRSSTRSSRDDAAVQTRTRTRTLQAKPRRGSVLAPPSVELAPPAPDGTPEACYEALRAAGVRFEIPAADGVAMPMRLQGPIEGVLFESSDKNPMHAILDCRLALSLIDWARDLHSRGVVRVEHYSMYRPGAHVAGDGRVSGHAHGLAIDAARFFLQDGTRYDVLTDWEGREHGGSPCPMRADEGFGSRLLRTVTCDAIDEKLFQVVVTPHRDRAHGNHVHLERKPEVDWTYVR